MNDVFKLIKGMLIMSMLSIQPVQADDLVDAAAIKTMVESVAVLADRGRFEALEQLYADEIELDYTSLTGGEVEVKSPQGLMNEWAAVLPGFDRTRHALSNIKVEISGMNAIASAQVIADHYMDHRFWQVSGDYRYELEKSGQDWRITHHQFMLRDEQGTREVVAAAAARAAENPPAYVVRQQTLQTVRDFLAALENKDMAGLADLWADDAVQDMPYSPPGHPKRVLGKADLIELYSAWPHVSGAADFSSELVFYPMIDPEMVFAEFNGRVDVLPTGREYRQVYGGLFHIVNGQIKLFREYYDPAPFAWAFGLDQP